MLDPWAITYSQIDFSLYEDILNPKKAGGGHLATDLKTILLKSPWYFFSTLLSTQPHFLFKEVALKIWLWSCI